MKKKIIKSYFFNMNSNYIYPFFTFSKRAVRLRKSKYFKYIASKPSIRQKLYSKYLKNQHTNPQWIYGLRSSKSLFLNSFYLKKTKLKKIKNRQLLLWFLTKKKLYRKNLLKNNFYTSAGFLSSHFVHFLVKKNLIYQNRSKFKKSINNMSTFYCYISIYANFLKIFFNYKEKALYFNTINHSKTKLLYDSEYNLIHTNWISLKYSNNFKNYNILNCADYNLENFEFIRSNKQTIEDLFKDSDKNKIELFVNNNSRTKDILQNINLYILNTNVNNIYQTLDLNDYISIYKN